MKPAKLQFQLGRGPLRFLKSMKGSLGSKRLGTTELESVYNEHMRIVYNDQTFRSRIKGFCCLKEERVQLLRIFMSVGNELNSIAPL